MSNEPLSQDDRCAAVPLTDLLRAIPADARLVWTEPDGLKATHFVPVGKYAHEAVDEIERLRRKVAVLDAVSDSLADDAARNDWRKGLPFWQRYFGGHITLGPLTIYGENAMHWAVNLRTRWGYVCFRLPCRCFGYWWQMYFYVSPDATPHAATFTIPRRARREY